MKSEITSIDKRSLESNIWKSYIGTFLANFVFFLPIIVLFWQANGLSFTQIMILQSAFAIAVIILELPTGFFADRYGRKKSLILSGMFLGLSAFVYSISNNFYQFLTAEIIWAVGFTLLSGTDSAFIYDTLSSLKREKEFKKIMGNVLLLTGVSIALGSLIGGIMGAISFRITIAAVIPFSLLFALLMLTIKEPPRKKLLYEKGHFQALIKIIRFALIKNIELRWLIIYFALVNVVGHLAFWFYQPYLVLAGLSIQHIGLVFAILLGISAIASKFAYAIENFFGKKLSLLMLPFLSAAALILMANIVSPISVIFVAILFFAYGFSIPVVQDYINKIVWSDKRATVLSLNNMGAGLVFAITAPLVGVSVDKYGITPIFMFLGLLAVIIGIVLIFFLKRNKVV